MAVEFAAFRAFDAHEGLRWNPPLFNTLWACVSRWCLRHHLLVRKILRGGHAPAAYLAQLGIRGILPARPPSEALRLLVARLVSGLGHLTR